ncbi:MAG: hypothetical protein GY950_32710, partial [bacterium]|nr:hypothetical protein [bacterium]
MNKRIALFLSIALSVAIFAAGILADQPKKPYHVPLTTLPVKIDGVIAE